MELLGEFKPVYNKQNLTFNDIWKIYDGQFETLRNYLISMGDMYLIEEFTGSTSQTLELENKYFSHQLFLFLNNVIQWRDRDYKEVSSRKVELLFDRKEDDVIQVVVIQTNVLQALKESLTPCKYIEVGSREREENKPTYGVE
jgi:hypothetical protein